MSTNLPNNWIVALPSKLDDKELFKKTVLPYINKKFNKQFNGNAPSGSWYGIYNNEPFYRDVWRWDHKCLPEDIQEITLNEFIEMTGKKNFKFGDPIEIANSYDRSKWSKGYYIGEVQSDLYGNEATEPKYICFKTYIDYDIDKLKEHVSYYNCLFRSENQIRPRMELKVTVTLNGKEIHPSKISEEIWNNLRNE